VLDSDVDIHGVNTVPPQRRKSSIKRAVISVAAAFGIKPVGRKWITAFSSLNGSFERTGWELSFYVATLVFIAAIITLFASFGVREYRHTGWSASMEFALIYCLAMSCLLVYLVSRSGLRYVFTAGTISAYNTWAQKLWSEDLTGLKDVSFFTARGSTTITLFWAERKRRMVLFDSLRRAMDTSLETVEGPVAENKPDIKDDAVPSWICPHCHEVNPGNFEECWKCRRNRQQGSSA
jgi:hypothetical protein